MDNFYCKRKTFHNHDVQLLQNTNFLMVKYLFRLQQ